jgi:hypothetical protein
MPKGETMDKPTVQEDGVPRPMSDDEFAQYQADAAAATAAAQAAADEAAAREAAKASALAKLEALGLTHEEALAITGL